MKVDIVPDYGHKYNENFPCIGCQAGWGSYSVNANGKAVITSCTETCPHLKAWRKKIYENAERDYEREAKKEALDFYWRYTCSRILESVMDKL